MFLFAVFLNQAKGQIHYEASLKKSVDSLLSAHFKPEEPGCAVLIAKKGQIVYERGFGSANLELSVPMQANMIFKLGSITKQFTAVAILQLAEHGKLSLQDSIQQYIKDFPSKGHTITLENLLTHTSGIPDYLQQDNPDPYVERRDFTPRQIIDYFKDLPLQFQPGTRFSYSNSGYVLLGYIVEKVSGESYQNYISKHILEPLSLSHTYFDRSGAIIPGLVSGYRKDGQGYRDADYFSQTLAYSAGELVSGTEDLLKWHEGLLTYKILKKETLEKAFAPYLLKDGTSAGYGYGWYVKDIGTIHSLEHGGKISGFLTNEMYYPEQDIFIAALFNCEDAPRDELSLALSGLALGRSLQADTQLTPEILNSYAGTYQLNSEAKRTIVITKDNNRLLAKIGGQSTFQLLFQSNTKFQLKGVTDASGEFVMENGKVTALKVNQNGVFVWTKLK
jgi:CubicO group peptidase (beta-lactamase class C family)